MVIRIDHREKIKNYAGRLEAVLKVKMLGKICVREGMSRDT